MGRCMVCGERTELDFTEFCDSCFELDLDELMKKFLQTIKERIEKTMRKLTVIERFYDNKPKDPHGEIRIKGKWLSQYDFRPGDKVSVIPIQGQIIIIKDPKKGGGQ